MNRALLYFIIFLILILIITLDSYSFKAIKVFRVYADSVVQPIAEPFFTFYKEVNTFFNNFKSKSLLIKTIENYALKLQDLEKENETLKNQLSVYKYVIKSYSQFSQIPNLNGGIFGVKLLLNNIFILNNSIKKAFAIDEDGNFIGIVEGNKLYSIYSRDFKCKIKINDSDKYGILQRDKKGFSLKYLQNIVDGKVFFCDDNLQIQIGEIKNNKFHPYFKMHYIPRVILLWRDRS